MCKRARFAKCFIILTEFCRMWIGCFMKKTIEKLIHESSDKTKFLQELSEKMTKPDFDLSQMFNLMRMDILKKETDKIITISEQKKCNPYNIIDEIRKKRNKIVHVTEASYSLEEYKRQIDFFKSAAGIFEYLNGIDTYVKAVEKMHLKPLDDNEVETILDAHKTYCINVIQNEPGEIERLLKSKHDLEKKIKDLNSKVEDQEDRKPKVEREDKKPETNTDTTANANVVGAGAVSGQVAGVLAAVVIGLGLLVSSLMDGIDERRRK